MRRRGFANGIQIAPVSFFGLLILILVLLAACGAGPAYSQQQTSDRYQVQLSLDGLGSGERLATVALHDQAGQPTDAEVVVLLPVMRQHGMASPEVAATRVAPGRYEARGEFFTMAGAWEIELRLGGDGLEETVSFQVVATE